MCEMSIDDSISHKLFKLLLGNFMVRILLQLEHFLF